MRLNEKKTENLVRNQFRALGYYDNSEIVIEEQKSDNSLIDNLLKKASKKGAGAGYPEFIIYSKEKSDFLIVIECKADIRKHESAHQDKFADYAVDGALWYASHLSKEFDVLAIGVSGEKKQNLKISHFLVLKNTKKNEGIFSNDSFLSFEDYYKGYIESPLKFQQDYLEMLRYSQDLNETLHAKKIKESQKSLLISGILIALQNEAFVTSYKKYKTASRLSESILQTIVNELTDASIDNTKVANMRQAYSFITTHSTLSTDKDFFVTLITDINHKINAFIKTHRYFDTLGQFYIEFLRYANNDKGLGIVLTPPHITELFSDVAQVDKNSIIVDNCCGTSGFMISAMKKMIADAKGDSQKIDTIKNEQILGIEFQDDIYALAVSNMIIHGDGKTNVYQGDCFDLVNQLPRKGTVGFLNPPYKTKKTDKEELEFVLNNLEMLEKNGTCMAIIPMRCMLAQKGIGYELKKKLLEYHTLEAVMSMPDELFHNSNVMAVTCIVVVTAHVPHPPQKKTWFGYWKDDKFEKVKNRGRIDLNNLWNDLKEEWLAAYFNREITKGFSVTRKVDASDEWCAEAYMETDYTDLTKAGFVEELKKYMAFKIINSDKLEDK